MKIWKLLTAESIFLNIDLTDKDGVLRFAAEQFARQGAVENAQLLYEGMRTREQVLSTGIGNGIGIPHTAGTYANEGAILLIRLARPIDFNALDDLPVDIVLALVVPNDKTALHLQILAGISRLCRNPSFLGTVRKARNSEDLLEKIKDIEEEMAFH